MSAIETILREPAIQALGWALLHFLWQGALVGALAALVLRALRNSGPDVRYVVGTIALAVMATLPVVTGVQAWRVAHPAAEQAQTVSEPSPSVVAGAAAPVPAESWEGLTAEDCRLRGAACPSSAIVPTT